MCVIVFIWVLWFNRKRIRFLFVGVCFKNWCKYVSLLLLKEFMFNLFFRSKFIKFRLSKRLYLMFEKFFFFLWKKIGLIRVCSKVFLYGEINLGLMVISFLYVIKNCLLFFFIFSRNFVKLMEVNSKLL